MRLNIIETALIRNKGITFAQLLMVMEKGLEMFSDCSDDVKVRNICVEVEKAMGIYPNIKLT